MALLFETNTKNVITFDVISRVAILFFFSNFNFQRKRKKTKPARLANGCFVFSIRTNYIATFIARERFYAHLFFLFFLLSYLSFPFLLRFFFFGGGGSCIYFLHIFHYYATTGDNCRANDSINSSKCRIGYYNNLLSLVLKKASKERKVLVREARVICCTFGL